MSRQWGEGLGILCGVEVEDLEARSLDPSHPNNKQERQ